MNIGGELHHLGTIRFAGPEAAKFLQGQISHDTQRLTDGSTLLASFNSPQGRVLAILALLPHSSGIIGILPRDLIPATIESLRKYVLRARVKIEATSEIMRVAGCHDRAALEALNLGAPADAGYVESNGIGIARLGVLDERYWIIGASSALQSLRLTDEPPAAGPHTGDPHEVDRHQRAWRAADIRAGRPQIYAATRELFVAQMLNLDLIDGISFSKGCYTGQEIIARTQHLGRIKRRMFGLRLPPGDWAVGQNLTLRDGRSGRIVESALGPDGPEVLAVLTLEKATNPEPGAQAGVDAEVLSLPYSV